MTNPIFSSGYPPSISRGNYSKPGFDADYEERMLFKYRDGLKAQIQSLKAEDSPYKDKAEEIEKNLNTVVSFVEKQIYEKQVLKEKQMELRKAQSERMRNPIAAARREERDAVRRLLSLDGKLMEIKRLTLAAKTAENEAMKSDLMRRAAEVSTEVMLNFHL